MSVSGIPLVPPPLSLYDHTHWDEGLYWFSPKSLGVLQFSTHSKISNSFKGEGTKLMPMTMSHDSTVITDNQIPSIKISTLIERCLNHLHNLIRAQIAEFIIPKVNILSCQNNVIEYSNLCCIDYRGNSLKNFSDELVSGFVSWVAFFCGSIFRHASDFKTPRKCHQSKDTLFLHRNC